MNLLELDDDKPAPREASLDDVIALTEEIVALLKAGVPLERSLSELGKETRGRLGEIERSLGARMSEGLSLPDAIAAERGKLPALYGAIAEAGLRSGRLTSALEGLTEHAKMVSETRRAIGMALTYPALVAGLGYGLFVIFVSVASPRLLEAFESLRLDVPAWLRWQTWLGETAIYWAPVPPLLGLALFLAWVMTRRASTLAGRVLDRLPMIGSLFRDARAVNFTGMLSLLVEHQTPFADSIELAAETTGDPGWTQAGRTLAESSRRGEPASHFVEPTSIEDRDRVAVIPSFVRWALAAGQTRGNPAVALRRVSESYRRRVALRVDAIRLLLPTILLIVIGGSVGLFYGITLFMPFSALLREMGLDL